MYFILTRCQKLVISPRNRQKPQTKMPPRRMKQCNLPWSMASHGSGQPSFSTVPHPVPTELEPGVQTCSQTFRPPPTTSVLLRICQHLQSYCRRVLLIIPHWEAQPWCRQLLQWCPSPLLRLKCFLGRDSSWLGTSLHLHALSFSWQPYSIPSPSQ